MNRASHEPSGRPTYRRRVRITTRNATFQVWESLLANRAKRTRSGSFLVQGVRPISLAVEHGWTVQHLLTPLGARLSDWASRLLAEVDVPHVELAPDLLAELGEKTDGMPEMVAVVEQRPDDLQRLAIDEHFLGVVFDRPTSPGNVGTLVRSADAFGAMGVVICGHAADPYDPKAVRASTGSLFAVPVVRAPSADEVLAWARQHPRVQVVGTDERGEVDLAAHDWSGPTLVVVGNETTGMSRAWREAADVLVRIPMGGAASSLNAAAAGTVLLYEARRQRPFRSN